MLTKTKTIFLLLLAVYTLGCHSEDHIDKYKINLDSLKTLPDGFYAYRRGRIYYEDVNIEKYRIWFNLDNSGNVGNISKMEDFAGGNTDEAMPGKYGIDTFEHKARVQKFIRLSRKFRFGHINVDRHKKISFSYRDGLAEQYVKALNDSIEKVYLGNNNFHLLKNGWFEYIDK
jgi:hypothetical protein